MEGLYQQYIHRVTLHNWSHKHVEGASKSPDASVLSAGTNTNVFSLLPPSEEVEIQLD